MDSNAKLKKFERKLRKHHHVLSKETGVTCSDRPTRNLGICNVGSINGLNEEIIIENFHKYGHLDRVLLIPGKSCAFLSYTHQTGAEEAFKACNGTLNIAQDDKPIYLAYVEVLPPSEDEKWYDRLPPGLSIIDDFVTPEEEELLLSLCRFDCLGGMKHRQVKHFGYEFRYDNNNVDKDKPLSEKIPSECEGLWGRLPFNFRADQLTVNHYKPGQGIPSHVDTHSAFEDPILSLSLNSAVVMEFKRSKDTFRVLLPPRSLLVMSGESRYAWTHGITPRKYDYYKSGDHYSAFQRGIRVSFTFRKIRKGECDCDYKMYCDSQKRSIGGSLAEKLESRHVHGVYEDIAGHFSETRHKPWPNVLSFVKNLKSGSVLVDVGCGNGKYFGHNAELIEIGVDRSFKLNGLCRDKGFEIFTGNCLNLPLRDDCADAVVSIAVIHHLSTEERRAGALAEMARILKPGGEALVYVWAKQQIKNQEKSTYIKQDRKNRKDEVAAAATEDVRVVEGVALPVHTNRRDFNHSDVLVPWKLKGQGTEETFLRFYHVFEEGELEGLCGKIEGLEVVRGFYDQGNYCVQFRKI